MQERGIMMLRSTLAAIATAAVLSIAKFYARQATQSAAMLGALADSLTDCLTSSVNLVAMLAALRPADDNHRFGHGKFEALAALAQALLTALAALYIAREGIDRLINPMPVYNTAVGAWVSALSVALTWLLVRYQLRVARLTRSAAVRADSLHYTSDLWSNGLLLLNFLLAGYWWQPYADAVLSVAAALKLAHGCYEVLSEAAHQLTDAELPQAVRQELYDIAVSAHPQAVGLHDLRTRVSGGHLFVQFHLELDPQLTVRAAHDIIEAVEKAVAARFPHAELFIHPDPADHPIEHPFVPK